MVNLKDVAKLGLLGTGLIGFILIVTLMFVLPAAIGVSWWFGRISFELAVILLLVLIAYTSGASSCDCD